MTTAASCNSDCITICIQGGDALLAPERSKYVSEPLVFNLSV